MLNSNSSDGHKLLSENQLSLFMIRMRRATDEQELVSLKDFLR